jgi:aldehyde decarbonylase
VRHSPLGPGRNKARLSGGPSHDRYGYTLAFEVLNALGHCNVELVPPWLYAACPPLKYLVYTSAFHSLHHSKVSCNYCLFMPLYDHVYGTAHPASDALHARAWSAKQRTADVVRRWFVARRPRAS